MTVVQLKLAPWDKIFESDTTKGAEKIKKIPFRVGENVVVKINSRTDLAKIIGISEKSEKEKKDEKVVIIRKANREDLKKMKEKKKRKKKFLKRAIEIIKDSALPIKLIDLHLSLDSGQIIFAFISPEKVDFRELVKSLSKEFHKSIRMHQISPREEIKIFPSFGPCGRRLCCFSFLKTLGGISTDLIEEQQLTHRGAERLSGPCGRLKCCLAFEREIYQELTKKLPLIGTKIKTKDKEGEVVA